MITIISARGLLLRARVCVPSSGFLIQEPSRGVFCVCGGGGSLASSSSSSFETAAAAHNPGKPQQEVKTQGASVASMSVRCGGEEPLRVVAGEWRAGRAIGGRRARAKQKKRAALVVRTADAGAKLAPIARSEGPDVDYLGGVTEVGVGKMERRVVFVEREKPRPIGRVARARASAGKRRGQVGGALSPHAPRPRTSPCSLCLTLLASAPITHHHRSHT
jgi:hypothetical protein